MARKKSLNKDIIMEKANDILRRDGLDGLEMRLLAKELNIAVGTLYNYYISQEALILDLFRFSWMKTKEKIDNEIGHEKCAFNKYVFLIDIIEVDVKNRKGIGRYIGENLTRFILSHNIINDNSFTEALKSYFDASLDEFYEGHEISKEILDLEKILLFKATLFNIDQVVENKDLFLQVIRRKFFSE